jgi:hypothetical protein
MEISFAMPPTGYPMSDFQQNVMEIILTLASDLGSIDNVNDSLFKMFELSFPHATHEEILSFTKVQGAFRCINQLAMENSETFNDLITELQSYKNT